MSDPNESTTPLGETSGALRIDLRREVDAELSRSRLNAEVPSPLAPYLLQEPARRRGRVITFYSYKGGVGRSRALANVALQMASQGKSVLCIDFDLEAPGLQHYFLGDAFRWPDGDATMQLGLVDFVHSYRDSLFARLPKRAIQARELLQRVWISGGKEMAFIAAGRQDRDYKQKVADFDWRSFYEHWDGGVVIDELKREFAEQFDYVLVDSRTGITDISGICSVHLPDILVAVFTPGPQSQAGLVDALQCIEANRSTLRPREPLAILPLPCRVDRDVVRESYDGWFRQLVDSYLAEKLMVLAWMWRPDEYFKNVAIEHFSRFVYDDTIESLVHDLNDSGGNAWKYRNLIRAIEAIGPVEFRAAMPHQAFELRQDFMIVHKADEQAFRLP